MARLVTAIALGIALGLAAPRAIADEARAEQLFRAGTQAYARGEFRAAATAFEQAHQLAPRGPTVLNAARAWESATEPARAADAYEAALQVGGLTAGEERFAKQRLARLDAELAVLMVEGPPGSMVSVGHRERAAAPTRIHLAPGAHDVAATFADGSSDALRVELERGAEKKLRLEARAPAKKTPAPPPRPPEPARAAPPSGGQKTLGLVLVGAGVVASGAAIYLGIRALDERDSYAKSERTDVDSYNRAKRLRLWTNVAWAAAIAAGGTGLVLTLPAPGAADSEKGAFVGFRARL